MGELNPMQVAPAPAPGHAPGPPSCCSPRDDTRMTFEQIREEERNRVSNSKIRRGLDPDKETFSIAFSGGGVRAAAFQAGVLRRLAEKNLLKNVEYLAAVSGGAYIASAFASFCLAESPLPAPGELATPLPAPGELDRWYHEVVRKLLDRMQFNSGNFVRDCFAHPGRDRTSGLAPRCCDSFILLVMLCVTMAVNPVVFFTAIGVPVASAFQVFFAPGLRAAFCTPTSSPNQTFVYSNNFSELRAFSSVWGIIWLCITLVVLLFVAYCVKYLLCASIPQRNDPQSSYLLVNAFIAFLQRFTLLLFVLLIFLGAVLVVELARYPCDEERLNLCKTYVRAKEEERGRCSDRFHGNTWYGQPQFRNLSDTSSTAHPSFNNTAYLASELQNASGALPTLPEFAGLSFLATVSGALLIGLIALVVGCVTVPYCGPDIFIFIAKSILTGFVLLATITFVEFGVFGPITGAKKNGLMPYEKNTWRWFLQWSLFAGALLLPFYEELRSMFHMYYKRCLHKNFFANGQDFEISDLQTCVRCPFLILTVTASDYQAPGRKKHIFELSFTPFRCGSGETRYIEVDQQLSLARCAALSGAGCLDALTLTMTESLPLRILSAVVNLSWGDYIVFTKSLDGCVPTLPCRGLQFLVRRLCRRSVTIAVSLGMMVMLNLGWGYQKLSSYCNVAKCFYTIGFVALVSMMGVGIFSSALNALGCSWLEWLGTGLLTRQFLQASKFIYGGDQPPTLLYVTDGGVSDCTGLVQLMRRRCKRILLVLAAADPRDELGVLRSAMTVAEQEKIGSFFDPEEPRRSVNVLLDDFKANPEQEFLHVGIYYSWPEADADGAAGDLYVVKNRLPRSYRNKLIPNLFNPNSCNLGCPSHAQPQQQLLPDPNGGEAGESVLTTELGPFGCCDCCHKFPRFGNCGARFPHGNFCGYLYLTPTWCRNLMRLGFQLSGAAADRIDAALALP